MRHSRNFISEYDKYFVSNIDYHKGGLFEKIQYSLKLLYSLDAKKQLQSLINAEKPDIVHLHNIYHQISPSILHVLRDYNIPVIMTLHDYKLACASYLMLNRGQVCEACKNNKYYQCFLQGCVGGSRIKSFLNTIEMYLHHKVLNIYNLVDIFIAPSIFLKAKMEEMGFEGKIVHLPYFLNLHQFIIDHGNKGEYLLYFGRLSKEKGLPTLIEAVKALHVKVMILGEGLLKDAIDSRIKDEGISNVEFLGYKTGEELKNIIRNSVAVIVPSEWYENFPFAVLESFALGKSVIGARVGGIPELVKDNETGLTFTPGDAADLKAKINDILENPDKARVMGQNARSLIERELNAEKHYNALMRIYERVLRKK